MLRRKSATRNDKGRVAVGKRNRYASSYERALTGFKDERFCAAQICSGVTRVSIRGGFVSANKYLNKISHPDRLPDLPRRASTSTLTQASPQIMVT